LTEGTLNCLALLRAEVQLHFRIRQRNDRVRLALAQLV
jgi:hypothetical protein